MSKYKERAKEICDNICIGLPYTIYDKVIEAMCELAEEVESNLYTGEDITELQAQYQAERLSLYTKEQLKEAFEAGREMHVSDTWDTWRYLTFEDYLKQINNGNNSSVLSE
jgi:hypothetical protein